MYLQLSYSNKPTHDLSQTVLGSSLYNNSWAPHHHNMDSCDVERLNELLEQDVELREVHI